MKWLNRAWAAVEIATRRIFSNPWLSLVTVLGMVISTALTISIPVYADAVYHRLFLADLQVVKESGMGGAATTATTTGTQQPAPEATANSTLTLEFMYTGGFYGKKNLVDLAAVDSYLTGQSGAILQLPQKQAFRYLYTDTLELFPATETNFANTKTLLGWVPIAALDQFKDHITLTEGEYPATTDLQADGVVNVLISQSFAEKMGLQVGETYTCYGHYKVNDADKIVQMPIRIAGVWQPTDLNDPYWFLRVTTFKDQIFVPMEVFTQQVASYMPQPVYTEMWFLTFDSTSIQYADAPRLVGSISGMQVQADQLLPNIKLFVSPVQALETYLNNSNLLTIRLYIFSVPIIGLILAFISLASGLGVEQRRNEIAVMRSRGLGTLQIIFITLLEGLILGGMGLLLSLPAGLGLAELIGQARSFLNFSAPVQLDVHLNTTALELGLAALALSILSQVLPAISAARHTVVSYKQERSRMLRRPWWQRAYLDLLLFIPAIYGAYLIQRQGSIVSFAGKSPFDNPLLYLVPALCIFACILFFIRILPSLVGLIAWISARLRAVGILMAARHLARTPGFYVTPLVILTLTLSLSIFTSSLADTLDRALYDQLNYQDGADLSFKDYGEMKGGTLNIPGSGGTDTTSTPTWLFLPVQEYLKIPWIQQAARVGSYGAEFTVNGQRVEGTFIGVDRYEFPQVSFWRNDFAPTSLVDLMNQLALTPDGIVAPYSLLNQGGLNIGDTLRMTVSTYGTNTDLEYKVAGGFNLFPTWYPSQGPIVVGDLDTFFQSVGGEFPYQVWARTAPNTDFSNLNDGGTGLLTQVGLSYTATLLKIQQEQERPDRQGLFGMLSAGFAASALLSVLGFLLYAMFSFRRRFIEFGVLRAVGLSYSQMVSYLAWELIFLIGMGAAVGTGLGVGAARWFIPYLQVGYGENAQIPPFIVEISLPAIYRTYVLFGVLFVVALIVLVGLLRRMKIFQAIKLGETV